MLIEIFAATFVSNPNAHATMTTRSRCFSSQVLCIDWNRDGRKLATGGADRVVRSLKVRP